MKIGAQLLASKLGSNTSGDAIQSAIGGLLGGGNNDGGLDLSSLIGNLQKGGLSNLAESWLGDDDNEEISEEQVEGLFGSEKIQEMASQLDTDQGTLLSGLKEALPQMVDKSSSGGSLFDSIGGVSGLAGLASKFLK